MPNPTPYTIRKALAAEFLKIQATSGYSHSFEASSILADENSTFTQGVDASFFPKIVIQLTEGASNALVSRRFEKILTFWVIYKTVGEKLGKTPTEQVEAFIEDLDRCINETPATLGGLAQTVEFKEFVSDGGTLGQTGMVIAQITVTYYLQR